MNQKMIAASLGALTLLGAGIAFAQPTALVGGREVARADFVEKLDARFAALDANKDGSLSDADRAAAIEARFKRIDSDGNGAVTLAEFTAADAARGGRFAGAAGEGGRAHRGRHHGGAGMGSGGRHGRGAFGAGAKVDANGDGAVSKAEFVTPALAAFDRTDANKDGKVTAAERQAARAARRGKPAA